MEYDLVLYDQYLHLYLITEANGCGKYAQYTEILSI